MCIIPVFMYSAALVPWTTSELRQVEALWLRARKYAWKLPAQTAGAPFQLAEDEGGIGNKTIEFYLATAQQRHLAQCLQHDDEVRSITLQHHRHCMLRIGAHTAAQAQDELTLSRHAETLRASSLLRLLKTAETVGCGIITTHFDTPTTDTRLLETIQAQRIHAALHPPPPTQRTTTLGPLPLPTAEWALHHQTSQHEKATRALVKAGCTTLTPILSHDRATIRKHHDLPHKLRKAVPKSLFNSYRAHILSLNTWQHTADATHSYPAAITSHFPSAPQSNELTDPDPPATTTDPATPHPRVAQAKQTHDDPQTSPPQLTPPAPPHDPDTRPDNPHPFPPQGFYLDPNIA